MKKVLVAIVIVLFLSSPVMGGGNIPPSWHQEKINGRYKVVTGPLSGVYGFMAFSTEAAARSSLGSISGARSVYSFSRSTLVFEGVLIPAVITDLAVSGALRLQHLNEGPTIIGNRGDMVIIDASQPAVKVQRITAPGLGDVAPCDHALVKHGSDAIRSKMAIEYCNPMDLEIWFSEARQTWMYVCPDPHREMCAVMYVAHCPDPSSNCYPMKSTFVITCAQVSTVVLRDGYLLHTSGELRSKGLTLIVQILREGTSERH